jgi:hypothetical protein
VLKRYIPDIGAVKCPVESSYPPPSFKRTWGSMNV